MSGRVLLDTNIVIALFAKEAVVQQRLAETDEAFISSIVLGELYYGAQKSSRVEANIARVNTFAAANVVLVCDTATAQYYGARETHLDPCKMKGLG
jgi:tRNA(fMet)-specific endonuclease VapC